MLTINTTAMMPVQAPSASPSVPYQLTYGIAILTVIHATRTPPPNNNAPVNCFE